jgi:hypothetical protein
MRCSVEGCKKPSYESLNTPSAVMWIGNKRISAMCERHMRDASRSVFDPELEPEDSEETELTLP